MVKHLRSCLVSRLSLASCMAVVSLAAGSSAHAASSGRSLQQWKTEWLTANPKPPAGVMLNVAIVEPAAPPAKGFWASDINAVEFNRGGFLQTKAGLDLRFAQTINLSPVDGSTKCGSTLDSLFECFDVDTLIESGPTVWRLRHAEKTTTNTIFEGSPFSDPVREIALQKWVIEHVQYDGVVLDQDGNDLLVALFPGQVKPNGQALLLRGSEAKYVVDAVGKSGAGLIQIKEREGGFGRMTVLVSEYPGNHVPIGTKFMMEQK